MTTFSREEVRDWIGFKRMRWGGDPSRPTFGGGAASADFGEC